MRSNGMQLFRWIEDTVMKLEKFILRYSHVFGVLLHRQILKIT